MNGSIPPQGKDNTIERIVYRREYFDLVLYQPGARTVITITNDGTIVKKEYPPKSRRAKSVEQGRCSLEDYEKLCDEIEFCIETADMQAHWIDDSSAELRLYHKYGRVQIMDRGLGNERISIGEIMERFFASHL